MSAGQQSAEIARVRGKELMCDQCGCTRWSCLTKFEGSCCNGCDHPEVEDQVPLVALIAAHRLTTPVQCACGWRETDPLCEGTWAAHLADVLRAVPALLAETFMRDVGHAAGWTYPQPSTASASSLSRMTDPYGKDFR